MKHRIRLQGYEFRNKKKDLILLLNKTIVSHKGNICFVMKDINNQEYTHWLNDIEKEQFKDYLVSKNIKLKCMEGQLC